MRRATALLLPLLASMLLASGCEEPDEEPGEEVVGEEPAPAEVDGVEPTPTPRPAPTPTPTPVRPEATAWSGVEMHEELREIYPDLEDGDILLRPGYDDDGGFVLDGELVMLEPVDDLDRWRERVEASLLHAGAAEAGEPWPGDEPVLRAGLGNVSEPQYAHAASMTFSGTIGDDPAEPDGYVVLMLGYTFDRDTGEIGGDPDEPIQETFTLGGLQFANDPEAPEPQIEGWRDDDDWEPPEVVASLDDAVTAAQPTAVAVMTAAAAGGDDVDVDAD